MAAQQFSVVSQFPFCQTIQVLSLAMEGLQTTKMQIQHTSFFTAEEIVTIRMFKTIYRKFHALLQQLRAKSQKQL